MWIKVWINNLIYNWNHGRKAKRLNSELEKRWYKPKTTAIIKILSELDQKAGLSVYNIIPFIKKIGLMPYKYSFLEKESSGIKTDRHMNDKLFKELEQLEFIRIVENHLFSFKGGVRYPTPAEDCILKIKLLPKGINYLIEHRKRMDDAFFKILSVILLFMTFILSIPMACNETREYFESKEENTIVNTVNDSVKKLLINTKTIQTY